MLNYLINLEGFTNKEIDYGFNIYKIVRPVITKESKLYCSLYFNVELNDHNINFIGDFYFNLSGKITCKNCNSYNRYLIVTSIYIIYYRNLYFQIKEGINSKKLELSEKNIYNKLNLFMNFSIINFDIFPIYFDYLKENNIFQQKYVNYLIENFKLISEADLVRFSVLISYLDMSNLSFDFNIFLEKITNFFNKTNDMKAVSLIFEKIKSIIANNTTFKKLFLNTLLNDINNPTSISYIINYFCNNIVDFFSPIYINSIAPKLNKELLNNNVIIKYFCNEDESHLLKLINNEISQLKNYYDSDGLIIFIKNNINKLNNEFFISKLIPEIIDFSKFSNEVAICFIVKCLDLFSEQLIKSLNFNNFRNKLSSNEIFALNVYYKIISVGDYNDIDISYTNYLSGFSKKFKLTNDKNYLYNLIKTLLKTSSLTNLLELIYLYKNSFKINEIENEIEKNIEAFPIDIDKFCMQKNDYKYQLLTLLNDLDLTYKIGIFKY